MYFSLSFVDKRKVKKALHRGVAIAINDTAFVSAIILSSLYFPFPFSLRQRGRKGIIFSRTKREQVVLLSTGHNTSSIAAFLKWMDGAVFINVRERGHISGLRSAIKMFL